MSNDPLANVIQLALSTAHRHLAETSSFAAKYKTSIAPFAVLNENTSDAAASLTSLLKPGETVYVMGDKPAGTPALRWGGIVACLQWLFPSNLPLPSAHPNIAIEELTCANSAEMLDLIAIAFPGYFREETCHMGHYFGIRENGNLVAMGGERMVLESDGVMWREISALCTHPQHTGHGYGTALLHHIIRKQRELEAMSFLHVVEDNARAIALYRQLGFHELRRVELHRLTKDEAS